MKIRVLKLENVTAKSGTKFWKCVDARGDGYSVWSKEIADRLQPNTDHDVEIEKKGDFTKIVGFVGEAIPQRSFGGGGGFSGGGSFGKNAMTPEERKTERASIEAQVCLKCSTDIVKSLIEAKVISEDGSACLSLDAITKAARMALDSVLGKKDGTSQEYNG